MDRMLQIVINYVIDNTEIKYLESHPNFILLTKVNTVNIGNSDNSGDAVFFQYSEHNTISIAGRRLGTWIGSALDTIIAILTIKMDENFEIISEIWM